MHLQHSPNPDHEYSMPWMKSPSHNLRSHLLLPSGYHQLLMTLLPRTPSPRKLRNNAVSSPRTLVQCEQWSKQGTQHREPSFSIASSLGSCPAETVGEARDEFVAARVKVAGVSGIRLLFMLDMSCNRR